MSVPIDLYYIVSKCGDFHPAVGLKRVTGGIAYPENANLRRKMPSFQPKTIFLIRYYGAKINVLCFKSWNRLNLFSIMCK